MYLFRSEKSQSRLQLSHCRRERQPTPDNYIPLPGNASGRPMRVGSHQWLHIRRLQCRRRDNGLAGRPTGLHDHAVEVEIGHSHSADALLPEHRTSRHLLAVQSWSAEHMRCWSHKVLEGLRNVHRFEAGRRTRAFRKNGDL